METCITWVTIDLTHPLQLDQYVRGGHGEDNAVKGILCPLLTGDEVNFRLTYDGPLKAATQSNPRRFEKHEIRRAFHLQLMQLWKNKDILHNQMPTHNLERVNLADPEAITRIYWEPREAEKFKRGNFSVFPIVREELHLVCDLDILFLRRENPGQLLHSGGDLDNRMKTLFDALRVPDEVQVRDYEPSDEEKLLFLCLVEDDKLITGFRITTDRLLAPVRAPDGRESDVRLIIQVEVKATKLTEENMGYFAHF